MADRDAACPVCDADLPLAGDERLGEQVFCSYCGAPSVVVQRPDPADEEPSEWELEEDF